MKKLKNILKNKNLFTLILLFFIKVLYSQSPIIGYDKVEWGASVEEVKKYYPAVEPFFLKSSNNYKNVPYYYMRNENLMLYIEYVNETHIKRRDFYFYDNKLCMVVVDYEGLGITKAESLYDLIVSKFGKFNDTKVIIDNYSKFIKEKHFIRDYNKNLKVEYKVGINEHNNHSERFKISVIKEGFFKNLLANNDVLKHPSSFSLAVVIYVNPIIEQEFLKIEENRIKSKEIPIKL